MLSVIVLVGFFCVAQAQYYNGISTAHPPFLHGAQQITGITPHGDHFDAHVNTHMVTPFGLQTRHDHIPVAGNPLAMNPLGINPLRMNPLGVNPLGINPLGVNQFGMNPFYGGVNQLGGLYNNPYRFRGIRQFSNNHDHHHHHRYKRLALIPVARYPPNMLNLTEPSTSDSSDSDSSDSKPIEIEEPKVSLPETFGEVMSPIPQVTLKTNLVTAAKIRFNRREAQVVPDNYHPLTNKGTPTASHSVTLTKPIPIVLRPTNYNLKSTDSNQRSQSLLSKMVPYPTAKKRSKIITRRRMTNYDPKRSSLREIIRLSHTGVFSNNSWRPSTIIRRRTTYGSSRSRIWSITPTRSSLVHSTTRNPCITGNCLPQPLRIQLPFYNSYGGFGPYYLPFLFPFGYS